jgi:mRNA interferase RelE/StbE
MNGTKRLRLILMSFRLKFLPSALKEWEKLDGSIKKQFKKVLDKRLENPKIQSARLSNFSPKECYKIKLKDAGMILVYAISDDEIFIVIIAIGKRNDNEVYETALTRISSI